MISIGCLSEDLHGGSSSSPGWFFFLKEEEDRKVDERDSFSPGELLLMGWTSAITNPSFGGVYGRKSLVGCSPWGRKESDTTEWLHFHFHALEKEMATHSSILAWRIPGTEEPGGLPSTGSHRVGHDWSNLAAAAEGENYCCSQNTIIIAKIKQRTWTSLVIEWLRICLPMQGTLVQSLVQEDSTCPCATTTEPVV